MPQPNVIHEFNYEYLTIRITRELKSIGVGDVFSGYFMPQRTQPHPA